MSRFINALAKIGGKSVISDTWKFAAKRPVEISNVEISNLASNMFVYLYHWWKKGKRECVCALVNRSGVN